MADKKSPAKKRTTKVGQAKPRPRLFSVIAKSRQYLVAAGPMAQAIITSVLRLALAALILGLAIWFISIPDWAKLFSGIQPKDFLEFSQIWAWPLVVLIAIVVLRPNFPEMIKDGFEFISPFGSLKKNPTPPQPSNVPKPTPSKGDAKAIADVEDEVKKVIDKANTKHPDVGEKVPRAGQVASSSPSPSEPELLKTLDRLTSLKSNTVLFERVNGIIYRSQLSLLQSLQIYEAGMKRDDVLPYYQQYKAKVPNGMAFLRYVQFLVESGLVTYDISSEIFRITDLGKSFLEYRGENNLTFVSPNDEY